MVMSSWKDSAFSTGSILCESHPALDLFYGMTQNWKNMAKDYLKLYELIHSEQSKK